MHVLDIFLAVVVLPPAWPIACSLMVMMMLVVTVDGGNDGDDVLMVTVDGGNDGDVMVVMMMMVM